MKKLLVCLIALFYTSSSFAYEAEGAMGGGATGGSSGTSSLNETIQAYEEFDFGDSVNWSDCFDFKLRFGFGMCPGWPPSPTIILKYSYNDIVAMVEVVPDPWRSYLYQESFYDFNSKAQGAVLNRLGIGLSIGAGYGNKKTDATSFIGIHRKDAHVWAIGDWWRLKTSSFLDGCLSLTCKNEDWTGCVFSVLDSFGSSSDSTDQTVANINGDEQVEGKGQGFENAETGEVNYEDGSSYEPELDQNGNRTGNYIETRPAGNYGGGAAMQGAEFGEGSSLVTGLKAAATISNVIEFAKDPKGAVIGAAVSVGSEVIGGMLSGGETQTKTAKEPDARDQEFDGKVDSIKNREADPLPTDTKTGKNVVEEQAALDAGEYDDTDISESGNAVSDNAMGNNTAGNAQATQAFTQMMDSAGSAISTFMTYLDMVVYFNVIEIGMRMIAANVPIMVHPVFMTERHPKAAMDGGLFYSTLFKSLAKHDAGMIAPIFCMAKSIGAGVMDIGNEYLGSSFDIMGGLGAMGSLITRRCIGSWGPMDPRVTIMGSGDEFISAGILSVRALDIAQSVTGSSFAKTINNTPFNKLKFNLDWPHQSSCYGFEGGSSLSRGWTTPLSGALDSVQGAVSSGNLTGLASSAGSQVAGDVRKNGGHVFTYWRNRKCEYWWSCSMWRGDTGL